MTRLKTLIGFVMYAMLIAVAVIVWRARCVLDNQPRLNKYDLEPMTQEEIDLFAGRTKGVWRHPLSEYKD